MNEIPLDLYRVFAAVVRCGSLTAAAQDMFISQSAVSQSVKKLENLLGGALLFRGAKGTILTQEGAELHQYILAALTAIDKGEQQFRQSYQLNAGRLHVGASDTLCRYYLLPILQRFHKLHPNVSIHVTNRTSCETIELLRTGKVDIGFVNLPLHASDMDIEPCLQVRDCLVASPDFPGLPKGVMSLNTLSEYPLLMLETLSNTRHALDAYALSHGVSLSPMLELGSHDLLVQFARIQLGLSFVTYEFALEELESGALVEIPLEPVPPARFIGIAHHKDVPLSPAAYELSNLCRKRS